MNITDVMSEQIQDYLTRSGRQAGEFQEKMRAFLTKIEPDIQTAVTEGDTRSLNYLRDRVVGETARVSLGIIHQHRQMVTEIIMTVVSTVIKLGLAA